MFTGQTADKRFSPILLAALSLLMASLACTQSRPYSRPPKSIKEYTLQHEGISRTYVVVVPKDYQVEESYPLVLSLHGGGGNAADMCRLQAGIQTLADKERFIVVCPQGVESHWNDGRQITDYRAHRQGVDDVGFLLDVIDNVGQEFSIDPNRIFSTGYSNGGMMSFRLACEAADRLAGAAPGIANLPAALECNPSQPISMMVLNGTEDPLMPYEGGQVRLGRRRLGQVLSTDETIRFWVDANDCNPEPTISQLPVQDRSDPTRIRSERYRGCRQNVAVWLYAVVGGGHTWPSGSQYVPAFIIGPVSNQANAAELIWEFFEGRP